MIQIHKAALCLRNLKSKIIQGICSKFTSSTSLTEFIPMHWECMTHSQYEGMRTENSSFTLSSKMPGGD